MTFSRCSSARCVSSSAWSSGTPSGRGTDRRSARRSGSLGSFAQRRGSPVSAIAVDGAAVVRAVHREHLAPAGHPSRHADGVLVGVGAAVGEEDLVECPGRDLGDAPRQLTADVVRHGRLDRREAARLLLDRGDEVGVLVSEVEVDELRAEVEVGVAVVVPEGRALSRGDRQRVDLRLRAPGVEDVRAVVAAHLGLCGPRRRTHARRRAGRRIRCAKGAPRPGQRWGWCPSWCPRLIRSCRGTRARSGSAPGPASAW